jgi:hypothetical protein
VIDFDDDGNGLEEDDAKVGVERGREDRRSRSGEGNVGFRSDISI